MRPIAESGGYVCDDTLSLRLRANRSHQHKHSEAYIDLKVIRAYILDFDRERSIFTKNMPNRSDKRMTSPNREKKHILLVEDTEDMCELLALTLAECRLVYARDFNEGLRLARLGYFDLYILDNWLPDRSGVELCRLIRKFDPHTPILFYSACAYPRDLQAAYSAGAQAYLIKPVSSGELKRAVSQLTSVPRESAFEARRAESAAILEELAIRQTENADRLEKAKQKRRRAEEKALRGKAQIAFLAAGGTRGEFARRWPSVLVEEVRNQRKSDAASVD
jgi:DNA-binding response OmpR family regulator